MLLYGLKYHINLVNGEPFLKRSRWIWEFWNTDIENHITWDMFLVGVFEKFVVGIFFRQFNAIGPLFVYWSLLP